MASLAGFVGTVQLRLKIEQATSTDDEPTPIYLLDEVVQSIGSISKSIADALDVLESRLRHRSPVVKQKALKLIKHAAQRGSPELRRALARKSAPVRELTQFRCAPDPFKGDIPWRKVQEYARDAVDAIHAAPSAQPSSFGVPSLGDKIQGFGSDAGGGGGSGSYGPSTMQGFGSDSAYSPRRPMTGTRSGSGGRYVPTQSSGSMLDTFTAGVKDLTDYAMSTLNRPQHQRLASADHDDLTGGYDYHPDPVEIAQTSRAYKGVEQAPLAGGVPPHFEDGEDVNREGRLVNRACKASGLRAAPSLEEIKAFVEAARDLDGKAIAKALEQKLEMGSWQESLRGLYLIEAMIEKSTSPSAGEVGMHFQSAPEAVRRASKSMQATVRQRAERVLRLLGNETLPSNSAQQSPSNATDNLLCDIEEDPSLVGAVGNAMDLLAGLNVSTNGDESSHGSMFPVLSPDIAPPQVQSHELNFLDSGTPPVVMRPAHANPPPPIGGDELLFGDWTAPVSTSSIKQSSVGNVDFLDSLATMSSASLGVNRGPSRHPTSVSSGPTTAFGMGPPLTASFDLPGPRGYSPVGNVFASPGLPSTKPVAWSGSAGVAPGRIADSDAVLAMRAATSGINSSKREDVAFDFVQGAMAQLKNKQ